MMGKIAQIPVLDTIVSTGCALANQKYNVGGIK
jgi:hypothetical protein